MASAIVNHECSIVVTDVKKYNKMFEGIVHSINDCDGDNDNF